MTKVERREKMLQLVSDWQQSGKSQKAYAQAHNIKLVTFRYWIQKHRQQDQSNDSFLQLGSQLASTGIIIRYPNGTELQLPTNSPVSIVKELLSL